jgi:RNA polymerase sigma-70 factor (ECF subfamily)
MSNPGYRVAQLRLPPEQIRRLLQELAPECREALALRIFSGLSAAEVAQIVGKSDADVKILVHQAVRDLRARIALVREGNR